MRKWLVFIAISVAVFIISWLVYSSVQKLEQKESRNNAVSSLPKLSILDFDGKNRGLNQYLSNKPIALVIFNSECEHCHYEAKDISKNIGMLNELSFIFLSAEEMASIRSFSEENGLAGHPNVVFGKVNYMELTSVFQSITYPNIFIYNTQGELLKEFKGETKVEAILAAIN